MGSLRARLNAASSHAGGTVRNKLLNWTEMFPERQLGSSCLLRRRWMGVRVSVGIARDSRGVREEAIGEVIPESLLCRSTILGRFGFFVDEIDRKGSIGNGKESCSSVVLGLYKSLGCSSMKRS